MKLRTIALATALVLSGTAALAVPMPQPKILAHGTAMASAKVIHDHRGNTGDPGHWHYWGRRTETVLKRKKAPPPDHRSGALKFFGLRRRSARRSLSPIRR